MSVKRFPVGAGNDGDIIAGNDDGIIAGNDDGIMCIIFYIFV